MKNLILLASIILFISCNNKQNNKQVQKTKETSVVELDRLNEIVRVRNCEYIKSRVYSGYVYTHCGDCNNPIHKNKQD